MMQKRSLIKRGKMSWPCCEPSLLVFFGIQNCGVVVGPGTKNHAKLK